MSSKPKCKTFIVKHQVGTMIRGRYRIGARNEKEAEEMLRKLLGKHMTTKVYYEEIVDLVTHGTIIKEC